MKPASSQTLPDRFRSSVEPYQLRVGEVACPHDSEERGALLREGWRAMAHCYASRALEDLERLVSVCQSPIEDAMLYALCLCAQNAGLPVRYQVNGQLLGAPHTNDYLLIEPQAEVGRYRADFLLHLKTRVDDFTDGFTSRASRKQLVIECDGHDFHDRTPFQASRDRRRDRELSKLGYTVFRYTGTDIWRDVMGCASESVNVLLD